MIRNIIESILRDLLEFRRFILSRKGCIIAIVEALLLTVLSIGILTMLQHDKNRDENSVPSNTKDK